jgi:N-acetylmuramoyl-L-alanine amidase
MKCRLHAALGLAAALLYGCSLVGAAQPLIILDPGHDPVYPGALGTCGESEYVYNDRIVAAYRPLSSYAVKVTREAGASPWGLRHPLQAVKTDVAPYSLKASLQARVDFANTHRGDVFISIHHDSVPLRHITTRSDLCDGKGGRTLLPAFKEKHAIGFNVFILQDENNPYYRDSLRLAKLLGEALRSMGRPASSYHYFPEDDCRSCRPVISDAGVLHQDLFVLRHVRMPAVLIEVGNIVDAEDEAHINTESFRRAFGQTINRAVEAYFSSRSTDASAQDKKARGMR